MPKTFDYEDEPNEFMDAPCRCDCGKWFDQSDGYGIHGTIVCRECYRDYMDEQNDERNVTREEMEDDGG